MTTPKEQTMDNSNPASNSRQAALEATWRDLDPAGQLAALRGIEVERVFSVEREGVDQDARTAWMSIASAEPYERWWGVEILDMAPASIRATRLGQGAPLLLNHDTRDQIGVIERYEITNGRLRVLARFSRSARAEEIWQDVLDGIRRNTSVGYRIHDLVLEKKEGDVSTYRVTDWEPYEGSLVPVPADPTVGVGRAHSHERTVPMNTQNQTPPAANPAPATDPAEVQRAVDAALAADQARRSEIEKLAVDFSHLPTARSVVDAARNDPKATADTVRAQLLESMRGRQPSVTQPQPGERATYGMGARERLYGSIRAFRGAGAAIGLTDEEAAYRAGMWARAAIFGDMDAQRWARDAGVEVRSGLPENFGFGTGARDMTEQVFSSAGWLVPVEMESAIIKNREQYGVARRICRVYPMTSSALQVPRIGADMNAYFTGEGTEATESDSSGDQVGLSLKDLLVNTKIGKSTSGVTVVGLAELVAEEQARAFAIKEDQCLAIGDGSATYGGMRGITSLLNTAGFSGNRVVAAAGVDTFGKITNADLSALVGQLPVYARPGARWLISGMGEGLVFGRLKLTAGGNTSQTVDGQIVEGQYAGFPVTLCHPMPNGAATDYTGLTMLVLGNFQQGVAMGAGVGMMMTVDPYSLAHRNLTRIVSAERIDMVAHGVLESTTVAGPIVGLHGGT
jgi:HK97 family phage major capsid protein